MMQEFINNFHFLRPLWLLLLLIPLFLYWKYFRGINNKSSWENVCDKRLLDFLLVKGSSKQRRIISHIGLCSFIAAGIAISITGTGFPHPLGYSITMLDGVPHGAACALFDGDYLEVNERTDVGREKLSRFYAALGVEGKVLKEALPRLSGVKLSFTEEEIDRRVKLISGAKNYVNSPYVLSVEEMYELYRKHFAK